MNYDAFKLAFMRALQDAITTRMLQLVDHQAVAVAAQARMCDDGACDATTPAL